MNTQAADEVLTILATRGHSAYHGEAVSQAEHALQAADLARLEGASPALIVAALVHDLGHLIVEAGEDHDARHEQAGADWVAERFGPDVAGPVRLHVDAKRYLCVIDPAYEAALSTASRHSLALQGGPMSVAEVEAFRDDPQHLDALRLRGWDDRAKEVGSKVPGVETYRKLLAAFTRSGGNT